MKMPILNAGLGSGAREAHNLVLAGSTPAPAPKFDFDVASGILNYNESEEVDVDNSGIVEEITGWITALKNAERMGAMNDKPEGARYIQVSDTLAQNLIESLGAMQVLLGALHVEPEKEHGKI